MYLTDEGLSEIEKVADKQKNVALLFLIDIYRMLKTLLKEQNNASNGSNREPIAPMIVKIRIEILYFF